MNIFDVLSQPAMLHAAVVHMPIALAIFGFMLIVACGVFEDSSTLRYITVIAFTMMVASVQYGIMTGEGSRELVPNTLPNEVWTLLDEHESMAHRVRLGAFITLIFVLLTLVRHREFRKGMTLVSGLASFATVLLVSTTAHYGGSLVYSHGVGTPYVHSPASSTASIPPLEAGGAATAGDELVEIRDIDMAEAALVDFQTEVWPIIDTHCIDCHEAPEPDGSLDLSTIESMLLPGEKAGPGLIPGDPDNSAIVQYIRGTMKPRMPHKDPPLDPELLHTIRMWIAAGAKPAPDAEATAAPAEVSEPAPEAPVEEFNPFG